MIEPTVGRIVLFHPHDDDGGDPNGQPHAAIVTHVHHDRLVNLTVFNENGSPYARQDVQLVQDDDPFPTAGGYAEWMAFQKGQATKTDSVAAGLLPRIDALEKSTEERFRDTGDFLTKKFAEIDGKLGQPPIAGVAEGAADPANPNVPGAS